MAFQLGFVVFLALMAGQASGAFASCIFPWHRVGR